MWSGQSVQITGTGIGLPWTKWDNEDIIARMLWKGCLPEVIRAAQVDEEWIVERTHILSRYIIAPSLGENTVTLATKAATQALAGARTSIHDIGKIIVATVTPIARGVPSTASRVLTELGATGRIAAYDINAGCTGFIYGLQQACYAVLHECERVLVIGVDCLSEITNWKDPKTAPLFGDGAGAMVLERSSKIGGLYPVITSGLADPEMLYYDTAEDVNGLAMMGKKVFNFAVKEGVSLIKEIMERDRLAPKDVACICLHQANGRITDGIQLKIRQHFGDIPEGRMLFPSTIEETGNTSAASIPITFARAVEQNLLQDGDHVLMVGFGAGLTSGAVHVVVDESLVEAT